jgi:hypothetical protein
MATTASVNGTGTTSPKTAQRLICAHQTGKYSQAELDHYVLLRLEGVGTKEARKISGVSHTPAELHEFRFQWLIAGLPQPGVGEWGFNTPLVNYLRFDATDDRGKKGWGIGKIMVALNASESAVRKAIREGGIDDRGHRTGKGGRFYADMPELYAENLRTDGTRIDLTSDEAIAVQAERQRLMKKELAELREIAAEMGITIPNRTTAVQAVRRILAGK